MEHVTPAGTRFWLTPCGDQVLVDFTTVSETEALVPAGS